MQATDTDRDWRLQAELNAGGAHDVLHHLVGRFHGSGVAKEVRAAVPDDVVVTHDGRLLFAYAASEAGLTAVRAALENVLRRDGIEARLRVSHWDDKLDVWRQTDPPTDAQAEEDAERDVEAIETRTLVATSGKAVRADFERAMTTWADKLGLQCKIFEHPHLLTTQVAFTVTGPRRKVDEFSQGLVTEGWAFVRAEETVMFSPL
jgi:hypothetical protein